jgi:putative phage-type endonuclease
MEPGVAGVAGGDCVDAAMSDVKDRLSGLGGSDAAVCAGVSPYKGPLQLFYEKTGQLEPDAAENEAMEWGTRIEPIVAEAYSQKTGRKVRNQPRKAHPKHPWMLGNIDRQIVGDKRGPGILEVKTTNTFSIKAWEEGPTDAAMLQLQHYLAIYGYKWGSIAVLIGGQTFKHFDVERDDELIEYLVEIELKFWGMVQRKEAPAGTWTAESIGILKRLYPVDSGKTIMLPESHVINVEGFLQAKKDLEVIEERKALYEGALKHAMAEASQADVPGYKLSWKSTKPTKKFDMDQFARDRPELVAQYSKFMPGHRRFLCKPSKEITHHE